MNSQNCNIAPFSVLLASVAQAESGSQRMKMVLGVEELPSDGDLAEPLAALFEAVNFDMTVRAPFFEMLNCLLIPQVNELAAILQERKKGYRQLTFSEAFAMLSSLRLSDVRRLITTSSLPSNTVNAIIEALSRKDSESFNEAIGSIDCSDWLTMLSYLRFVLFGIDQDVFMEHIRGMALHNHWLKGLGFKQYFVVFTPKEETAFVESEKSKLRGECIERLSGKRHRVHKPDISADEILTGFAKNKIRRFIGNWSDEQSGEDMEICNLTNTARMTALAIFKEAYDRNNIPASESKDYEFWEDVRLYDWRNINSLKQYVWRYSNAIASIFLCVQPIILKEDVDVLKLIITSNYYSAAAYKLALKTSKPKVDDASADKRVNRLKDLLMEFIDHNFNLRKRERFQTDYLIALAQLLSKIKDPVPKNAFVRLFYPQTKSEGANLLNPTYMSWKELPRNYEEAFSLFKDNIFLKDSDLRQNIRDAESSISKQNEHVKKIRRDLDSEKYPWLKKWIEEVYSDDARRKVIELQPKTKSEKK